MEPSLLVSFLAFFAMVLAWLAAPAAELRSAVLTESEVGSRESDVIPATLTP